MCSVCVCVCVLFVCVLCMCSYAEAKLRLLRGARGEMGEFTLCFGLIVEII